MLYYLNELFSINIFGYITVRSGIGFFIGFIFTLLFMPKFIRWAIMQNVSQPIYDLAPSSHQAKAKTPTMGGIVFIISTLLAVLISGNLSNSYLLGGIFTIISVSAIGFIDDIAKIKEVKNEAGLSAKTKLFLQIIVALSISIWLYNVNFDTNFNIPFYKYPLFDMGIWSILFWSFVIVGTSNAVNLTDGLDGLATMPSVLGLITYSVIAYIIGHAGLSSYLLMPNLPIGEVVVLTASFAGSLLGFLWFNANPAEVFMGDSGSLTIGAFLGYIAIITKSEILLILVGIIFVIETASVIIQVYSYKTRGKRVFLMAPIHHHFEQKGWRENKIIVRFWIISIMANLLALISLKIR
jgi:phospho-N-acetylmuramoyl-pentapeptide-transferase